MDPRFWHPKQPEPQLSLAERLRAVVDLIECELRREPGFEERCFLFEKHRRYLPHPYSEDFRGADVATDDLLDKPVSEHASILEFYRPRIVSEWSAMLEPLKIALQRAVESEGSEPHEREG